jgi:hypothetical protein
MSISTTNDANPVIAKSIAEMVQIVINSIVTAILIFLEHSVMLLMLLTSLSSQY